MLLWRTMTDAEGICIIISLPRILSFLFSLIFEFETLLHRPKIAPSLTGPYLLAAFSTLSPICPLPPLKIQT